MLKNKLLNLIKNNVEVSGKRFEVVAVDGSREATVYLYDVIDNWFGVDSEGFVQAVVGLDVDVINLRIDSPGGDVFDARAMWTVLKQHKAEVVAHIDGLCASAATYVALAADRVVMSEGAMFMIHQAWTMAYGNESELRKTAQLLEQIDGAIANDYLAKTGIDKDQLLAWMAEEKWLTASEAKELGFIDEVFGGSAVENRFDLSAYDRVPDHLVARAPDPEVTPKPAFNARTPLLARLTELAQ